MTFEELVAKSIEHADTATAHLDRAGEPDHPRRMDGVPEDLGPAAIHATLAEAYARLASAVIVNRTSLNAALESIERQRRPD